MATRPVWIQIVVFRICVFLFAFAVMTFGLFLVGNVQEFLDSTQLTLLRLAGGAAFFFLICGLYFLGIAMVLRSRGRRAGWGRVVVVSMGLIVALAVVLFSNFLQSWIEQVG